MFVQALKKANKKMQGVRNNFFNFKSPNGVIALVLLALDINDN
jgi:hypothetical protein